SLPPPCHGPQCSGRPALPPIAPVALVTIPASDWAVIYWHVTADDSNKQFRLSRREAVHSVQRSDPFFRPPR
ncbi:MAG TPA: hypothetical protein VGZ47_03700, partial [Gemmataceae bacterium]|nr:hypothetical protein [Gemmataceae bacterium]